VLEKGQRFTGPSGTTAEVVESSRERFVFERTLPPGTGKGMPHLHLDYVQTFEVLEGAGTMRIGRERRDMRAGETIKLERRTAHVDPWNEADSPLRFRMTIAPQPYFIEVYAATWTAWLEAGKLNRQDEFGPLQIVAILHAGRAESFGTGPPIWLQRGLISLVGPLARRRHPPVVPKG
jgi:mannose-6-phosphate isomerase-like protein (cupin superfamily)